MTVASLRPAPPEPDGAAVRDGSAGAVLLGVLAAAAFGLLAAALAGALLTNTSAPTAPTGTVATGLGVLAEASAALVAAALAGVLLTGALAAAPGDPGRAVRRHVPRWAARTAALLVVIATGAPAATATPGETHVAVSSRDGMTSWDGLDADDPGAGSAPLPSWTAADLEEPPLPGWRPLTPPVRQEAPVDLVSRGSNPDPEVVVRRGDTLWDIAGRHLGPTATAEQVAREWPRWYDANRHVIGPDPDLILPGQRLLAPGSTTGSEET